MKLIMATITRTGMSYGLIHKTIKWSALFGELIKQVEHDTMSYKAVTLLLSISNPIAAAAAWGRGPSSTHPF